MKITAIILAVAFVVSSAVLPGAAAPLTGSGANLPVPGAGPPASVARTVSGSTVAGPWQGNWVAPALAPWLGTFDVEGPQPSGIVNDAGVSRYSFAGLPGGVLPAGTFFLLGDVDGGSATAEGFVLTAISGGSQVTTAWLDEPVGVGGAPAANHMPSWNFAGGVYKFDGGTVAGNPTISVYLPSNVAIDTLIVERPSQWANFGLLAPVPEPGTAAVLAVGAAGWLIRRRRRF